MNEKLLKKTIWITVMILFYVGLPLSTYAFPSQLGQSINHNLPLLSSVN